MHSITAGGALIVYDGHLLLMLAPILFLFYASVVIYRRNPAG